MSRFLNDGKKQWKNSTVPGGPEVEVRRRTFFPKRKFHSSGWRVRGPTRSQEHGWDHAGSRSVSKAGLASGMPLRQSGLRRQEALHVDLVRV